MIEITYKPGQNPLRLIAQYRADHPEFRGTILAKREAEVKRRWMFQAEDENGDTFYLQEDEFVGLYQEAADYASVLGDAWEAKTGGLILKLTIESRGKVE